MSQLAAIQPMPSTIAQTTYLQADNYEEFRLKQLEQERFFLIEKIKENNGSVSITADKLGMLRTALYNRLNRLGVSVKTDLQN